MNENTLQKMGEILSNAEIDAKLDGAQDLEQIVGILREQGLEITEDELAELVAENAGGELNEETLEAVAGGYIKPVRWKKLKEKLQEILDAFEEGIRRMPKPGIQPHTPKTNNRPKI